MKSLLFFVSSVRQKKKKGTACKYINIYKNSFAIKLKFILLQWQTKLLVINSYSFYSKIKRKPYFLNSLSLFLSVMLFLSFSLSLYLSKSLFLVSARTVELLNNETSELAVQKQQSPCILPSYLFVNSFCQKILEILASFFFLACLFQRVASVFACCNRKLGIQS